MLDINYVRNNAKNLEKENKRIVNRNYIKE